jgi:radical SAM superfamily enzyme
MLNSVCFVTALSCSGLTRTAFHPFGIKITSLYVLQNTRLATMYESGKYQPLTKEQYFALLQKALPLLPENCVVHRLTGDPPKRLLIAPSWPADKKRILNEIRSLDLSKTVQNSLS